MPARPEVVAIFAEFVRLNPSLPPDHPVMARVLDAYEQTMPAPLPAPVRVPLPREWAWV